MGADISLAAAMLLVAFGAWQNLWQSTADRARALLLEQPALAAPPPDGVRFGETHLQGSSAQPVLTLHDVVLHGVSDGQTWEWRVGDVILTLHPNDVNRLEATLPSPQQFNAEGPLGRSAITVWSRNLSASILLNADGQVRQVTANGDGLTLFAPGAEAKAAALTLAIDQRTDGSVGVNGTIDDILLPETHRLAPPLGGSINVARVTGWVTGVAATTPDGAAAWRDSGGTLGLSEFAIEWGPFHLSLDGRAALDTLLRPEGRFTVAASGLADALDAAHASELIGDTVHRGIQRSLDQIGSLRGTEAADDVRLSLAMAGGTLSWSGIPLARLPSFNPDETAPPIEATCDSETLEVAVEC